MSYINRKHARQTGTNRTTQAEISNLLRLTFPGRVTGWVLAVWFGECTIRPYQISFSLHGIPFFLYLLVLTLIWVTYCAICEANFRKTIGKSIVGIEIQPAGSLPFSAEQAWRRNLMWPIDAFGFYLLGFLVANSSKCKQTIGDRVADTVVYEEERPNRTRAVWTGILFFLGGAGLNVVSACFVYFLIQLSQ